MAGRAVNLLKTPPRVELIGHRLFLVLVGTLPPLLAFMAGQHDLVCDLPSNLPSDVSQAMLDAAVDFHAECADALDEVEFVLRLSFPLLGRLKRLAIRPPPSPAVGYERHTFVVSYEPSGELEPASLPRVGLAQAPINMFRLCYPPQGPRAPPWLRSGTFFDLTEGASPRLEAGMGAPPDFKAHMGLYLHALTRVCQIRDQLLPSVAAAAGRTGIKLQMRVAGPERTSAPQVEIEQAEARQFSFDVEALQVDILANGVFEIIAPPSGPPRPWHAPAYMYLVSEAEAVLDVHAATPQWRIDEFRQLAAKTHELQYPATRAIEGIVTAFDPHHPRLAELVPVPPKVATDMRRIRHACSTTFSERTELPQLAQVGDARFALHYPPAEGLRPSVFSVHSDELDTDERLDEERIVMVETLGIVVQQLFA